MTSRPSRPSTRDPRSGFALLLVLSLLAFLILLLVSLASFTRVETATAGLSQQQAQARQNARLALDIALAQLQAYAGPDRRITATAEAWDDSLTDGRRYWTGVWDATTSSRNPLTWLVSGNETNPLAVTPSLPPPTGSFNPPRGTDTFVDLVASVGSSGGNRAILDNANQRVTVRLVPIQVEDLPGFPAGERRTIGRYGFWVGDEGVKAPLSTVDRTDDVTYNDSPGTDYSGDAPGAGFDNRFRLRQAFLPLRRTDLALAPLDGSTTLAEPEPLAAFLHPAWDGLRAALVPPSSLGHFYGVDASGFTRAPAELRENWNRPTVLAAWKRQRELFHDVTWQTASVLTNTHDGGLRRDLDGTEAVENDIDRFDGFDQFFGLRARRETAVSPYYGSRLTVIPCQNAQVEPLAPGETGGHVVRVVSPVITEFQLDLGVNVDPAGGPPTVRVTLRVELWNPWTSELELPSGTELVLDVLGNPSGSPASPALPPITVSDGFNSFTINLARTLGATGANESLRFTVAGSAGFGVQAPGHLRSFTVTRGPLPMRDEAGTEAGGIWLPLVDAYEISTGGADPYTVSTELRLLSGGSPPGGPLVRHVGLEFEPVSPSVPLQEPVALRWHYRMRETTDLIDPDGFGPQPLQPMALGVFFDPRGPRLVQQTAEPVLKPFHVEAPNPAAATTGDFDADATRLLISGAEMRPVLLFDAPRAEILSLGQFQHLPARPLGAQENTPAYRVGNPVSGGVRVNRIFDRYFSSGVPRALADSGSLWGLKLDTPIAFTPLQLVDDPQPPEEGDLRSSRVSRYVVVRNGFNINSTSVAAWRTVLAGVLPAVPSDPTDPATGYGYAQNHLHGTPGHQALFGRWQYADSAGNIQIAWLRNAFFRFPFGAQDIRANLSDLFGTDGLGDAANVVRAAYRAGFRQLTDRQVQFLAERVVERIRERMRGPSGPFRSLEEFLDAGILRDALADNGNDAQGDSFKRVGQVLNRPGVNPLGDDTVPAGSVRSPPDVSEWIVPRGSPMALTQADIVQQLAPIAFARSDTFRIRAYGESINPALDPSDRGYVQGRAWLEAVVQRVPGKHPSSENSSDDLSDTGNQTGTHMGRRFRIVSFRWLGPEDI